jgi:hypothetical protein
VLREVLELGKAGNSSDARGEGAAGELAEEQSKKELEKQRENTAACYI